MAGMIVFNGPLRPAIALGCPNPSTKPEGRLWEIYPAPAIWRTFQILITAVAGSDRCHVFRCIGRKIFQRVTAAGGAQRIDHPAFVEGCRSIAGDAAQRGGERRLAMDIARPRGRAIRQENARRSLVLAQ